MGLFHRFKKEPVSEFHLSFNDESYNYNKDKNVIKRRETLNIIRLNEFGNLLNLNKDRDFITNLKATDYYFVQDYKRLSYGLSIDTLNYIYSLIEHNKVLPIPSLRRYFEDFQMMYAMGVLSEIRPEVRKAYVDVFKNHKQEFYDYVKKSDLVLGIIDYYGYIEITELNRIINNKFDPIEILNNSLIAKNHIIMTKDVVYRKEIEQISLPIFLKEREELSQYAKDYKKVEDEEYLNFAHKFINTEFNLTNDKLKRLYLSKFFVLDEGVEDMFPKDLNEEELAKARDFNLALPKWSCKGYSMLDMVLKKQNIDL